MLLDPFHTKTAGCLCMLGTFQLLPKFLGNTEESQRANGLFPIYSHEEFPAQHACAFSRDTLTATVSSPSHSGYCPSCCLLTCSHLRTGMFVLASLWKSLWPIQCRSSDLFSNPCNDFKRCEQPLLRCLQWCILPDSCISGSTHSCDRVGM